MEVRLIAADELDALLALYAHLHAVDDPLPAGIASQTWTCTASGGAACTSAAGAGAISDTIATFPAGSFVTRSPWLIHTG